MQTWAWLRITLAWHEKRIVAVSQQPWRQHDVCVCLWGVRNCKLIGKAGCCIPPVESCFSITSLLALSFSFSSFRSLICSWMSALSCDSAALFSAYNSSIFSPSSFTSLLRTSNCFDRASILHATSTQKDRHLPTQMIDAAVQTAQATRLQGFKPRMNVWLARKTQFSSEHSFSRRIATGDRAAHLFQFDKQLECASVCCLANASFLRRVCVRGCESRLFRSWGLLNALQGLLLF